MDTRLHPAAALEAEELVAQNVTDVGVETIAVGLNPREAVFMTGDALGIPQAATFSSESGRFENWAPATVEQMHTVNYIMVEVLVNMANSNPEKPKQRIF